MGYIKNIIHEKSCGAVVWRDADGKRLYLLEEMQGGHFAFPKGHVEPGESEQQTAEREIREETGLTVQMDLSFRAQTSYSPYPGCLKEVVYFCAFSVSSELRVQPEEVKSASWLPFESALERLSFDNDREILRCAEAHLKCASLKNS